MSMKTRPVESWSSGSGFVVANVRSLTHFAKSGQLVQDLDFSNRASPRNSAPDCNIGV